MQLVALGPKGTVIRLCSNLNTIGRSQWDGQDTRISRQHVTVNPTGDGATVTALKPCYVHSVATGEVKHLQSGQVEQLNVGDTIYLLKAAGSYTAGFQLQYTPASHTSTSSPAAAVGGNPTQSSTATAGSPSSFDADAPAVAKRYKSATPANPPPPPPAAAAASASAASPAAASLAGAAAASPAAAACTSAEQHNTMSTVGSAGCTAAEAGGFGAAIAAAAQAGSPDPAAPAINSSSQQVAVPAVQQSTRHAVTPPQHLVQQQQPQQQQQQQQLFAGVRLVDWDGHHTHLALTRAAEEGAVVGQVLDNSTTHVLARQELSAAEVHRRLQTGAQKQQQPRHHRLSATAKRPSPRSKPQQRPTTSPHQQHQAGKQTTALVLSPGDVQQSPPTAQQRQEERGQGGGSSGSVGGSSQLPAGVQFVTVAWVSSCLRSRQRVPEAHFYIPLQHQLQPDPSGVCTLLPSQPPHAPKPSSPAADRGGLAGAAATPLPAPTAAAATDAAAAAGDSSAAGGLTSTQQQQQQQAQEQGSTGGKVQKRAQKQQQQQVVVPGPEEICEPGMAWGTDDRWIEPWDEAAALESMDRLMVHWHQTTAKHPRLSAGAATSPPGGSHHSDSTSTSSRQDRTSDHEDHEEQLLPFQQQQQEAGRAGGSSSDGGSEAPCEHVACSRLTFCLVEEMERLKRNYHGRADQFRIKAASRAILELERLQQPILGPQDIEALAVGEKSKEKLQEILQTGRLRRNDVLEGSELHRTLQLFMTVWGCADSTARKWWAEGCRSLEDVRSKASGLTAIQQMGLRYYDDFQHRIPRAEVTEAVAIIRETVLDVLQELTGKARSDLNQQLHVRALGSYVRGKLDTGDIDMLLAPGPAAEDVMPGPLSTGLLQRLKAAGFVPEGLTFDHRSQHSLETAPRVSWMGVYKGPSSPCYRRLDIKAYERAALPYAVNYFSSGQDCSRAIRYWCNRPTPEVASLTAVIHPAANAFHLSDTGLYVVYKAQRAKAAASPGSRKRPRLPAAATAAAAAAAADGDSDGQAGVGAGGDNGAAAAVAAGIPVMTTDSHGPAGPAGRVECSCESDIFRAVGLAYVPPHLRSWH